MRRAALAAALVAAAAPTAARASEPAPRPSGAEPFAVVHGEPIPAVRVERRVAARRDEDPAEVRRELAQALIRERALRHEARRLGLPVPPRRTSLPDRVEALARAVAVAYVRRHPGPGAFGRAWDAQAGRARAATRCAPGYLVAGCAGGPEPACRPLGVMEVCPSGTAWTAAGRVPDARRFLERLGARPPREEVEGRITVFAKRESQAVEIAWLAAKVAREHARGPAPEAPR